MGASPSAAADTGAGGAGGASAACALPAARATTLARTSAAIR
jgi:hypothetical protein